MDYYCKHIMTTLHTVVRCYDSEGNRIKYYGYDEGTDPLFCDREFEKEVLGKAKKEYPIIYSEVYPIYYGVLDMNDSYMVMGPVSLADKNAEIEGMTLESYIKKKHGMSEAMMIPICKYEHFCASLLLLFYAGTGVELSFELLNEYNFLTPELIEKLRRSEGELMFRYQEHERKHNPYGREQRILESIRKGDRQRLIDAYDEIFEGEYGWLSDDGLRRAKNLAIVASGLAARAAIEGGVPYERAFSMSDNCIRCVDESDNIGKVKALERQNHLDFVELVNSIKTQKDTGNRLVEDCKNMIFRRLHSTIKIKELAGELGVTQEYLAAVFKKGTGRTITDYILTNKIRLSENMLIYSEYNIGEISQYLGFYSQSHFDRTFRKYNHMSPIEYRKRYRVREDD